MFLSHNVKTSPPTSSMGSQTYGVQVGNETYSVVATDEDWEKRRIERERQKRLSQETNRRRKALEERKKLAEEREARKRILQLSKRRQRQTEATEKYQRSHIGTRSEKKPKNASGNKRSPTLDNVLQQLRSGNTEISYPYTTEGSRVTSTQLMNHSRFQFENKLQEEHKRLLDLHRANVTKEFKEEIYNDLHPNDFENSSPGMQSLPPQSFHPAQPPQDFSSIDLMSGRMQSPYYHPAHHQGPPAEDPTTPDAHGRDFVQLADSLSRLFVKEEPRNVVPRHTDVNAGYDDDYHHNADDLAQGVAQQQYVRPQSGKTRPAFPSKQVTIHEAWRSPSDLEFNNDDSYNQESLHGSSGSGTPPAANTMTSFQKKYAESAIVNSCEQLDNRKVEGRTNTESSPRHHVESDLGYYVKAYRPWSAVETATNRDKEKDETKAVRQRPMSAAVAQNHVKSSRLLRTQNEVPPRFNGDSVAFQDRLEPGKESIARWGASPVKTKATPISEMYNETWMKSSQPFKKSDDVTDHPTVVVASPMSPIHVSKPPQEEVLVDAEVAPRSSTPALTNKAASNAKSEFANDRKSEESSNVSRKSILRGVSKYAPKPSYQTEAAAARQHWVDHMVGAPKKRASVLALNGADIRDSLDIRSKSVRWHEIHYDDGTSAAFTEFGTIMRKTQDSHQHIVTSSKRSPRANKGPKSKPQSKPKAKPGPEKSAKKSSKGGKGRKLKPAKEAEVTMEPHPPSTSKKQLSIANNLNYSIANESDQPNRTQTNEPKRASRTAWGPQETENVTLDTLKSSGSHAVEATIGPPQHGRNKNQVTINIESPEAAEPPSPESVINLTKTPTDQEINWLWDKVRKCISQRNSGRSTPLCKSSSDISRFSGSSGMSRQSMYGAPPTGQQRASIVSIDGAMFTANNTSGQGTPQSRGRRINRPHSAVNTPTRQTNRLNDYGSNLRRQALLQQRRNKLLNMHRAGQQVKSPARFSPHYPAPQQVPPTPSYYEPFPSARGSVGKVDDSTTTFLLAETLAEQNLSEDQITKAMESLERRTKEAQARGRQVLPSALSMEEQHLLKSLERLNARLCEVEMAMSSNPNVDFFHSTNGSKFRPNRVHSADTRRPPHYGQHGRHQKL